MKIPGLPIGIRLPWIITIPLLIIVGLGYLIVWVVKKFRNVQEKDEAKEPVSP